MIWLLLPILLLAEGDAEATADKPLTERVSAIVADLGADAYERREAAQRSLASLPAEAMPIVSRAYRDTHDAEVRMRLRLYADQYFERHVISKYEKYKRPGYLGIMQQDGQLEDGTGYVLVQRVMPGTGAEKAGLEAGDQIISLNGNPMPAVNATLAVARYVQAHHAGDQMRITVLRGEKKLELTATLGGLPDEHLNDADEQQLRAERERLREQWWEAGFLAGNLDFEPQAETQVKSDEP